MKFGEQIVKSMIQEWAHYYIDYDLLKETLSRALEKYPIEQKVGGLKNLHFLLDEEAWPNLLIKAVFVNDPRTKHDVLLMVEQKAYESPNGFAEYPVVCEPTATGCCEPSSQGDSYPKAEEDPLNSTKAGGGGTTMELVSTEDGIDSLVHAATVAGFEDGSESRTASAIAVVGGRRHSGSMAQRNESWDDNGSVAFGNDSVDAYPASYASSAASPSGPGQITQLLRMRSHRPNFSIALQRKVHDAQESWQETKYRMRPEEINPNLPEILEAVQRINNVVARVLASEIEKVNAFYQRESQLVCGAAAVCVDSAKRLHLLTQSERANLQVAFRQVYLYLDRLQQFSDLNMIAVAKFLKKFDKNTFQSSLDDLRQHIEHLPFSSMYRTRRTIQLLKGDVFDAYRDYMMGGSQKRATEALYLKDRAETLQERMPVVLVAGFLWGLAFCLFVLLISEFAQFDFPLSIPKHDNTVYWLSLSFTLILLPVLFGFNVLVWEGNRVNFAFVFDLDPLKPWSGLQIIRSNTVYLVIWLICAYATLRTAAQDVRCGGSPSEVPAWSWPYVILPTCIVVKAVYVMFHSGQHWFLDTLKRCLLTPLYPVEFRDFFLLDQLASISSPLLQLQFFWCYLRAPAVAEVCSSATGQAAFGLAGLPPFLRLLQCLRRYRDMGPSRTLFPHVANAARYFCSLMAIVTLFLLTKARYEKATPAVETTALVFYLVVQSISTVLNICWDTVMDFGFVQVSWLEERQPPKDTPSVTPGLSEGVTPQLEHCEMTTIESSGTANAFQEQGHTHEGQSAFQNRVPPAATSSEPFETPSVTPPKTPYVHLMSIGNKLSFSIRHEILYPSIAFYWAAVVVNIILRLAWIPSFLIWNYVKPSPWRFVVFSSVEIIRRFLWNFFRVESEQLNNYEHYRATRFAPLPTRHLEMEVETAEDIYRRFQAKVADTSDQHGAEAHDWSAVTRCFARLPEKEKRSILRRVDPHRHFRGKQFEGKSKFFSTLPEAYKAHLLLSHMGKLSLQEYFDKAHAEEVSRLTHLDR